MSLLSSIEKAIVKQRRKRVSNQMYERYNGTVQYGAFKGLKLDGRSNVSRGPLGLKIFGLYEPSVLHEITKRPVFGDLVNIGAADGYFSLGLLKAGIAKRSICFEMTEEGRDAIKRNAEMNGLTDRVVILGQANQDITEQLAAVNFESENSLVLCDIEGAEFSLFTPNFLNTLKDSTIIIEIHDKVHGMDPIHRANLIDLHTPNFDVKLIIAEPADWSGIADLEQLTDNDRALVTSEGRKAIGEWLLATPKHLKSEPN